MDPPVPSQHPVVPVHQHRHIESKTFNASGDLADLSRGMLVRILWIEPERSDRNCFNDEPLVALWRHVLLLSKPFGMPWTGEYGG
jgi:hypothetical protein